MIYKIVVSLLIFGLSQIGHATTIKIVVPYTAGGSADIIVRAVESKLNSDGIDTYIEYRLGGGGNVAFNYVSKLKNKETVLLLASNGLTDGPVLNKTSVYNLAQDFIFVKNLGTVPNLLVVSKSDSAKSFQDLVNQSHSTPIFYGSSGIGSGQHIMGKIATAKFSNFIHVPYKGGRDALLGVMNTDVKFTIDSDMVVGPYIRSGLLKPLAVMNQTRLPNYPNVPTLAELGINDYNYERWFVLVANSSADPKIIKLVQKSLAELDLRTLGIISTDNSRENFLLLQQKKFIRISKELNFE